MMEKKRSARMPKIRPKNVIAVIDFSEEPVPEVHGERVREIRKREHLTQADMAALLGIDIKLLSKIENGDSLLSAKASMRLYKMFGYSFDWIYGISEIEIAKPEQDKYLVDIRNIVRFEGRSIHITIPEKFFDLLGNNEEFERIKNELQGEESENALIRGVAEQKRKLLIHKKNSYRCATIDIESFECKKKEPIK